MTSRVFRATEREQVRPGLIVLGHADLKKACRQGEQKEQRWKIA